MNTTQCIRGLAIASAMAFVLATGRSARSVVTNASPSKKALLAELEKACLAASKNREPADAAADCECLKAYDAQAIDERYLQAIINTYNGAEDYDTVEIADDLSIALENDASALFRCVRDPNWFRSKSRSASTIRSKSPSKSTREPKLEKGAR